jgi:hypothetical protein
MNHAVLPEDKRGVQGCRGDDQGGDHSAGHSQDTVGPRESEDSEHDVFDYRRGWDETLISQTSMHDCVR